MNTILESYNWFYGNASEILFAITSIVTGASVIAKFTPTQADDNFIAKVIKVIDFVALNKSRK